MQEKRGISLIVLVIAIIVMIILGGAIVITLNNSGIIDRASNAVEQTNLATVKELAQMAWASAYANGDTELDELQSAVDKALIDNKVDTTRYVAEATTKGVNIILKGPWKQTRETVTNGEITINLGEKINYIATGTNYTGDWKVLGASKYGELLIMSDSNITTCRLGHESTTTDSTEKLKESQDAWLYGATELDKICEPYGKGEGATSARSVTVEDVNRALGYDPKTAGYGKNEIHEYENTVTYAYNTETKKVTYTSTNGANGTLSDTYNNGFHYYDGNNFVTSTTTVVLTSNSYGYKLGDGKLELTDKAALLIFGEYDELSDEYSNAYWLASPYIGTYPSAAHFGMCRMNFGSVSSNSLWNSNGYAYSAVNGVRAVITLKTNVKIIADSAGNWNINK